jgi:small subunit ribosomal protein S13
MPEFRGIIRVAGKDMKGELPIAQALTKIKGIGKNLAANISDIISTELKLPPTEKIGNLTDEQVDRLEEIITNPEKYGVPEWMLNRRNDPATGKTRHLISSDLDFQNRNDIETEKNMKSYRGIRHMFGLPVRGQRTKTMGRKGLTVGVVKRKEMPTTTGKKDEKGGKAEKKK